MCARAQKFEILNGLHMRFKLKFSFYSKRFPFLSIQCFFPNDLLYSCTINKLLHVHEVPWVCEKKEEEIFKISLQFSNAFHIEKNETFKIRFLFLKQTYVFPFNKYCIFQIHIDAYI